MLQHQILFQDPFNKTEKHTNTLQVTKVGTKYLYSAVSLYSVSM
jgi:hypothetical protein